MSAPTVQELLIKLEKIEGQLDNLRLQQGRTESDVESEKRTRAERNDTFDKQIDVLHDLIYNRDTGIAFVLDRLIQKDKKREAQKLQIIGLYITVGILVLGKVIDWLTKN